MGAQAIVIVETEQGERYDVSFHVLHVQHSPSMHSFCSPMRLVLANPGLPYVSQICPGCRIFTTFQREEGDKAQYSHRIEQVAGSASGTDGSIGTLEIDCRGIEGQLLRDRR